VLDKINKAIKADLSIDYSETDIVETGMLYCKGLPFFGPYLSRFESAGWEKCRHFRSLSCRNLQSHLLSTNASALLFARLSRDRGISSSSFNRRGSHVHPRLA
jgi:hypothetical protein